MPSFFLYAKYKTVLKTKKSNCKKQLLDFLYCNPQTINVLRIVVHDVLF